MATPLERPDLPVIEAPIEWPAYVVSVFGPGDRAFGAALVAARPGAVMIEARLRHAPGFDAKDGTVTAHPDALVEALGARAPSAPFVVGVGAPFAVAVRADLRVWIADGLPLAGLPPALRPIARAAELALEEGRPALASALARAL